MVTHPITESATTAAVGQRERADYWTELIDSYHGRLHYEFPDRENFHGLTRVRRSRAYQLVGWESDAVTYRRTARQIRTDPDDDYRLLVPTTGRFGLEQDDEQGILLPGTAFLVTLDQPFGLSMSRDTSGLILTIPRREVRNRLNRVAVPAQPLDFGTGLGRVVGGLAASLHDEHAGLTTTQFDAVADHLVDLVCLLILSAPPDTPTGLREVEASVRGYIATHAGDPGLTGATVARALGWSVRQVQLALQQAGTTPRELIREHRLRLAADRLRHPAYRHQSITDIALDLGFGSISAFSTAFRQRFDTTPSDLRSAAFDTARGERG
ncbi:helix-turn-helix domain-containing protein [Nocardia aurantia]|uniref:Transcriptional activator FeaR n=1 Tax=Nocardia aurantia TaxID=2585199 RepID=A0A7K0DGL3_9NOCA|nr:helix-turn-helix domain-containing protein [Nocardia aurantia]MQY24828.1 Transcriptional activator FeaR [Nocardia aurantia]